MADSPYLPDADAAADAYAIPRAIFHALIDTESGWNQWALSNKGAIGLTQLMPGTANELGVNAYDAKENLKGGAKYLRQMFDKFGDWGRALMAYNAGPNNINAGADYSATVLGKAKKEDPTLGQVAAGDQPQDWWHGSVGEQILNWITGAGPTPIGKGPPVGSPEEQKRFEESMAKSSLPGMLATGGKYFGAGLVVIIAVGLGMFVLARSGYKQVTR